MIVIDLRMTHLAAYSDPVGRHYVNETQSNNTRKTETSILLQRIVENHTKRLSVT